MGNETNEQFDAILMSMSAIAVMASVRYNIWRMGVLRKDLPWNPDDDAKRIRRLCEMMNDAMQYIGDVNNGDDAVDSHGLTDAAFAQMRRALDKEARDG